MRWPEARAIPLTVAVLAVWAYVLSIYLYKIWFIATAAALAIVFALITAGRVRAEGLVRASMPVAAYFLVLLAGAFWAEFPGETIRWTVIDSIGMATFVLFFIAGRNAPPEAIVRALSTICIPSAAIAALNQALEPWATRSAQYAAAVLPFVTAFLCLQAVTSRRRWPALLALATAFAVLVVGRNRMPFGTACVVTAIAVIAFRRNTRSAIRQALVYGVVVAATIGALLFIPPTRKLVVTMFVRLTHIEVVWGDLRVPAEGINQERVVLTKLSLSMLPDRLPLGIGYMNFSFYFEDVMGFRLPLHNMYMTWLLEGGVACALIVLLLAALHVQALRAYLQRGAPGQRAYGKAIAIASAGLLLLGSFYQIHQAPALWMLLGLGAACGAEAREMA